MAGLASFSLFGEDPDGIYREGALVNARMYGELYPDVICRFYVSPLTLEWATENLTLGNCEVHPMPGPDNQAATLWRFQSLHTRGYAYYLFRDTDSRPILRERAAVAEWLASDRTYHVMRDHPYHNVPMMAGLWGVKAPVANRIARLFPVKPTRSYYQVDQQFLRAVVWRAAKHIVMSHSGCGHSFGEETVPFPVEGDPSEGFVGEGFFGDGRPRFPGHARAILG